MRTGHMDSSLPPMWYPNYWCERQSSDPAPLTPQSQVPVCVNPQQPCLVFNKVKPQPILGLSMSRQQLVQPTQDGAIPNSNFQSQNATRQSETIHPLQQAPLVAVDESQLEGKSAPIVPETSTGLQHAARQFLCESAIAIPMTDSGSNKIHATFQGNTFMNFQLPPNADAELSETVHQLQQQISDGSLSVVPIPFNMMPLSSTNDFQESLKFQAASTHELSDASDIVQQPTSATPRSTDSNLTTSQSSFTEDPYRKIISPDKQPVLTRPLDQTVTLDSEANVPVAKNPVECCESALAATRMAKEHNVPADYTGSLPQDTHCGEPKSIPATELFTTETNSGCEEVQPLPIRFLHSLELATASPANSQMIPANVTTTDTLSFSKTTADNV